MTFFWGPLEHLFEILVGAIRKRFFYVATTLQMHVFDKIHGHRSMRANKSLIRVLIKYTDTIHKHYRIQPNIHGD